MNVLFLTLANMESIYTHAIYPDLMRTFIKNGWTVYSVSPSKDDVDKIICEEGSTLLQLSGCKVTKVDRKIKKGLLTLKIGKVFKEGIKKYFLNVKFDLIVYATPPITFYSAVKYVKKRDHAYAYLLLKDIFPQNAADIGLLSSKGVRGILYRLFQRLEKKLYRISDTIGCMSEANVKYLLKHHPDLNRQQIEICPNSIEIIDFRLTASDKIEVRRAYGLPIEKTILVYGGNLGKPQGLDFLVECIKALKHHKEIFFLIVGDGTEYNNVKNAISDNHIDNVRLLQRMPSEEYNKMIAACDIGMIFLDSRFTIPNFPSRLLSYMQTGLPVLCCTDRNTDIGNVAVTGGFGWKCDSNDLDSFINVISSVLATGQKYGEMVESEYKYLEDHYSVDDTYQIINQHLENTK